MKVFVAGATGAVGARLVPHLVARGHDVVATTRSEARVPDIVKAGAAPVIVDGLDREGLCAAVVAAKPEVVVHEMTGLAGVTSYRHFDDEFALTNRLRTEGTDNLLAGARAAGARRVVAQSFGNWNYERTGAPTKREESPLDPDPPAWQRQSLAAIRHVEAAVTVGSGLEGVALRYALLYGPGTGFALDGGDLIGLIRARRLPIVGDGAGVWSFIHVDDAASATVAAIEGRSLGIFNVADDEPARVTEWLPDLARAVDAKPPRRVPVWVGRIATGEVGVSMMTKIRGASNAKAKRDLDWRLRFPSWREGFRTGLGDVPVSVPDRPRAAA